MASIIQTMDDLDGTMVEHERGPLTFTVRGNSYEIDLNEVNEEKFNKAIARFVKAAREVKPPKPAKRGKGATANDPARLAAIRAWARENGHEVSDRGRIPGDIVEAYANRDKAKDTAETAEPVEPRTDADEYDAPQAAEKDGATLAERPAPMFEDDEPAA